MTIANTKTLKKTKLVVTLNPPKAIKTTPGSFKAIEPRKAPSTTDRITK